MNRLREEMFRYHSMQLAGFVFQACSIDHSDISPFRINNLRTVGSVYRKTLLQILMFRDAICIQRFAGPSRSIGAEIVSDLRMSLITYGDFWSGRPTIGPF